MKTNTSPIAVVALAMANVTDLILMYFLLHRAVFILVRFFLDKGQRGRRKIRDHYKSYHHHLHHHKTLFKLKAERSKEREEKYLEEEGGRGQGEEVPLTEEPHHAISAP